MKENGGGIRLWRNRQAFQTLSKYSNISDVNLDDGVKELLEESPGGGKKRIMGVFFKMILEVATINSTCQS